MVVKVYGMARAVCPQRVLACLLEKGVEFELVHVDLDKGEQKDPNFLLLQVRVLAYTQAREGVNFDYKIWIIKIIFTSI